MTTTKEQRIVRWQILLWVAREDHDHAMVRLLKRGLENMGVVA